MSEPVMGVVICRPKAARKVALLATALSLFGLGVTGAMLPTPAHAASDTAAAAVFAIESPKAAKGLMIDVVHAGKRLADMVMGRGQPSAASFLHQPPQRFPFQPFLRLGQRLAYSWYRFQDAR